jgi:cyanate permease
MSTEVRRWLAFVGGCMTGIAVAGLAIAILDALVPALNNNGQLASFGSVSFYLWGLVLGAGIGIGTAMLIRDQR